MMHGSIALILFNLCLEGCPLLRPSSLHSGGLDGRSHSTGVCLERLLLGVSRLAFAIGLALKGKLALAHDVLETLRVKPPLMGFKPAIQMTPPFNFLLFYRTRTQASAHTSHTHHIHHRGPADHQLAYFGIAKPSRYGRKPLRRRNPSWKLWTSFLVWSGWPSMMNSRILALVIIPHVT